MINPIQCVLTTGRYRDGRLIRYEVYKFYVKDIFERVRAVDYQVSVYLYGYIDTGELIPGTIKSGAPY